MEHAKKLEWIHKMTKLGLDHVAHYDSGGTVLGGPTTNAGFPQTQSNAGLGVAVNNLWGTNNPFNGQAAPIQAGTNAAQLNNAYTGAQSALGQQQNLTTATQPGVAQGLNAQGILSTQLANEANGKG